MEGQQPPITPPGNEGPQPPQQAPTGELAQNPGGGISPEDVKEVSQSGVETPDAASVSQDRLQAILTRWQTAKVEAGHQTFIPQLQRQWFDTMQGVTPLSRFLRGGISEVFRQPTSMEELANKEQIQPTPERTAFVLALWTEALGMSPDELKERLLKTETELEAQKVDLSQNPGGGISPEDVKEVSQSGIEAPPTNPLNKDTNTTNNT